jgi:phage-related protein
MNYEAAWTTTFYRDRRGRSPVQDFLDGLDGRTRARVVQGFSLLEREGTNLGMPLARQVTGYRFWELRVQAARNNVRVFYFALSGRRILLLHAFLKKSQQTPRRELEIAARRLAEVVESKQ